MARVPQAAAFAPKVQALPQRTKIPQQRQLPQKSASAQALTQLGAGINSVADEQARVGAINQSRDEGRENQARVIRFKQDILNYTHGNKDLGITGLRELGGQQAADGVVGIQAEIEKLRQQNLSEITSPVVRDAFETASQNASLATQGSHAIYVDAQKEVAREETDKTQLGQHLNAATETTVALLNDGAPMFMAVEAMKAEAEGIIAVTLERAARKGFDKDTANRFVANNVAALHKNIIDRLVKDGKGSAAAAYLDEVQSQGVFPPIPSKEKTALIDSIKSASVLEESQQQAQVIIALGGGDNKAMLAAVDNIPNPEVKKAARTMIRAHIIDRDKQIRGAEKELREQAIVLSGQGKLVSEMPTEIQAEANRIPGFVDTQDKKALRVKSGRPVDSDIVTLGEANALEHENKAEFVLTDFTKGKWLKLDGQDLKFIQGLQRTARGQLASDERRTTSELEADANLTRARSATRNLAIQLKVKKSEAGSIDVAMAQEIGRRTRNGEKLDSKDYLDIYRGLYLLQGEQEGGVFFGAFDKNVRLFDSIANRESFDMSDFTSENEKTLTDMAAEAGLTAKDGAIMAAQVIKNGGVPTAETIREEADFQLQQRSGVPAAAGASTTNTTGDVAPAPSAEAVETSAVPATAAPRTGPGAFNNPGNLRPGADTEFDGKTGVANTGGGKFLTFSSPHFGTRALSIDLRTKSLRGLNTVQKILTAFAPASENPNLPNYIAFVAKQLNVKPTDKINTANKAINKKFVSAVARFDTGPNNIYTPAVITRAVDAAFKDVK